MTRKYPRQVVSLTGPSIIFANTVRGEGVRGQIEIVPALRDVLIKVSRGYQLGGLTPTSLFLVDDQNERSTLYVGLPTDIASLVVLVMFIHGLSQDKSVVSPPMEIVATSVLATAQLAEISLVQEDRYRYHLPDEAVSFGRHAMLIATGITDPIQTRAAISINDPSYWGMVMTNFINPPKPGSGERRVTVSPRERTPPPVIEIGVHDPV